MTALALAAGLLVVGLAALVWGYRATGGTTLRAVWWWVVVALWAVVASEFAAALTPRQSTALIGQIRFIAGVATLCPLVALLGAKRPQNQAWQFVVAAFWFVLALPAIQNLALRPDAPLPVHPIWSLFLAAGILFGLMNYLPTPFAPAAILAAAGQWLILTPQLPWNAFSNTPQAAIVGLGLIATALAVAACNAAWRRSRRPISTEPLDRLWLDFRDAFGVVWSLRIAERLNASPALEQLGVRLTWRGFTRPAATARDPSSSQPLHLAPPARSELERALRALLLRFVSSGWIARRVSDN
jgi:hypothetical protein